MIDKDVILDRFRRGRADRDDVVALVAIAGDSEAIRLTVCRFKPPGIHGTVRLIGRTGPSSLSDSEVRAVGTNRWSAEWRVADLRAWLASH